MSLRRVGCRCDGMLGSSVRAAMLLTALIAARALFWPCDVSAQVTAAKEGAEQNSATHSVSGTVVNAITGAPVAHALVQVQTQSQRETSPGTVVSYPVQHATFTDENGQFTIEGLAKTTRLLHGSTTVASIQVFKPGYFSTNETPGPKPFVNIAGDQAEPVRVSLMPDSVITGHVVDENGEPVTRAMVTARCARVVDGRKQWQDCSIFAVDEDGAFRMPHLMPGSYYLQAQEFGSVRQSDGSPGGHNGYLPAYYPVERDGTSHGRFELRAGARYDATLKLREGSTFNIYGMVSGVSPPLGSAILLMTTNGERLPTEMQLDPGSGTFVLKNVPPGAYRIRAESNNAAGQPLSSEAPVTVGNKDAVNIDLALRPALTIPVVVHTEFTRDPAEAMAGMTVQVENATVTIRTPLLNGCLQNLDRPEVTSCVMAQLNGDVLSQEIHGVVPGRYSVTLRPQGSEYAVSMTYEGADVMKQPLVVQSDATPGTLEVTVRDDSGMLGFSLNDATDDSRATVLIMPDKGPPFTAVVGGRGEASISSIPPGEYKVYAFDRAEDLEYRNPDVLAEYATRAASVTLGPNEKRSVKLDVIHRSEQ